MEGQLPPQLSPAGANAGPAVAPQGNQGNTAAAMLDVQNAIKMLEKSLPMIPLGSPLHTDILNVTKTLSKHITPSPGGGGSALELQSLVQMAKQAAQAQPMSALSRLFPSAGGNTPPALPQQPATGA